MKKESVATGSALGGGAAGTMLVFATGCLGTKLLLLLGVSSGVLGGLEALGPTGPCCSSAALAPLRSVSGESSGAAGGLFRRGRSAKEIR